MDVTSTGPGRGARSLEVPSPAFFMAACGCDSRTPENMVAIQVALAMQDVMRAVNTQRTAEGKCTVELGLGVHCAEVVHSFVGTDDRMEFTAIEKRSSTPMRVKESQAQEPPPWERMSDEEVREVLRQRLFKQLGIEWLLDGVAPHCDDAFHLSACNREQN